MYTCNGAVKALIVIFATFGILQCFLFLFINTRNAWEQRGIEKNSQILVGHHQYLKNQLQQQQPFYDIESIKNLPLIFIGGYARSGA